MKKIESHSAEETMKAAEEFSKQLKAGDILRLEGDLGAGKTTFVKGLARGFGIKEADVKSPTYVLMHVYEGPPTLYHFDLYRLEGASDLDAFGFEDFLLDPDAITCVEWADKAEGIFPPSSYVIRFSMNVKGREISIEKQANGGK